MPHPFDGINEKLDRADQNIVNLNAEINAFIGNCEYPTIPGETTEAFQKAMKHYKELVIPPRFSVLSGEIIHHFRSCLDHIVWYFSANSYRKSHQNIIEFPIFETRPRSQKELARYAGKIQGISKPSVRRIIDDLQPYKTPPVANHILALIHNMDRFDKHRELAVTISCVNITFPDVALAELVWKMMDQKRNPATDKMIGRAIKHYGNATPQVAFSNFGTRKVQAITPALITFLDTMREIVDVFSHEL